MSSSKLRMVASLQRHKLCSLYISKKVPLKGHYSSSNKSDQEDIDKQIVSSTSKDEQKDSSPASKTVSVVPGKGPPPEPPVTCCMTGCANCVWISYAEELKTYYGDTGDEIARKALDHIEDPSLKAFIKFELGIK